MKHHIIVVNNIEVTFQLESTYLLVKLLFYYLEVLLLDLAILSLLMIVLLKVLEGVILTVMIIHLLHDRWVSCPNVNQLVPHGFLIPDRLFNHSINVLLIDRAHFSEEFECVVAACHIVLEDVVDQAHLVEDPTTE